MTPTAIAIAFLCYTGMLFLVSGLTSRKADNQSFFIGNRASPWMVVAYGMIGASLSGVTFISVPGWVRDSQFSYLMVVFGYLLGYAAIAGVLLPLYYRMNLTSIYTYLGERFGFWSYKMGALFFLFSRFIGSSLRMYLVVSVLQVFVFDAWGVPFAATASLFILLILLYTFRGGIKTIVWTDTLQTTFMLTAVVLTVWLISREMGEPLMGLMQQVRESEFSKVLITDWQDRNHYLKQFFSGAFIAIVMTGLDQDMMQKNLSCRTLRGAQKNMITLSITLVFVNLLFLTLGALLYIYADFLHIETPAQSDELYPLIALRYLSPLAGIVFIIGLISAAYSSADSALTALTTSISLDFLKLDKSPHSQAVVQRYRRLVHIGVATVVLGIILIFSVLNNKAVIQEVFTIAGYTYGPLLGMFSFGIFTRWNVKDKWVPLVVLSAPLICYILSLNSMRWFSGYVFGFELLIVNGLITFLLLWLVRQRR